MPQDLPSQLDIDQLQPNPFQPRSKIMKDDLDELVQSVKAYGILEPLVVAETPAGYQIIAGERRWRAAKEAGLKQVPVLIKRTTPKGMLEMALVENVQRIDLSPIERGQAFYQLIRDFHFSTSQLASKVGKSAPYISNSMKLLELPDAIKDGLVGGEITEGHARALSTIDNERDMVECYKRILKESASVRRAEVLARFYKDHSKMPEAERGRPMKMHDDQMKQWQAQFQKLFQAKTQLKLVRSQRQTRVTIILNGTVEETQKDLEKMLDLVENAGE